VSSWQVGLLIQLCQIVHNFSSQTMFPFICIGIYVAALILSSSIVGGTSTPCPGGTYGFSMGSCTLNPSGDKASASVLFIYLFLNV
jgi:hypothetical protein